ncbi:hypothetical protein C8R44DRAFT_755204 [Mycena epipterygia]|nr:hypothetical protein C8R44DRAFT_755204 [Mycena epipterygia]
MGCQGATLTQALGRRTTSKSPDELDLNEILAWALSRFDVALKNDRFRRVTTRAIIACIKPASTVPETRSSPMQLKFNLLQVLLLNAAPRLVASPGAATTSSPENTPIYVDLGSLLAPESAPFMKASLSAGRLGPLTGAQFVTLIIMGFVRDLFVVSSYTVYEVVSRKTNGK